MFLPPNAGTNAAFLETLRLTLVHETRSRGGTPNGLELAFATPRRWLLPGKTITVRNAPTSFGVVTYPIVRTNRTILVTVEPPRIASPRALRLRLRLPHGTTITRAVMQGRPARRDNTDTFTLPPRAKRVQLTVTVS